MRVSILLLGALLVAIYITEVNAEHRHHKPRGPPKRSSYRATPYNGKSKNTKASTARTKNSKGGSTASNLFAGHSNGRKATYYGTISKARTAKTIVNVNDEPILVTPRPRAENNVCPLNEEISQCVSPCRETCATMGKDLVCNSTVCNKGCDCRTGYFRNSTGSCVAPKDCDCPNNQRLNLCFNNCPPVTCDAIGKQFNCSAPNPNNCKPGCTCPRSLKMDGTGVCVPVTRCPPKTCKENEMYSYEQWCFKEKCGSENEPCVGQFFDVRLDKPVCTCKRPNYCRNANGNCVANTGRVPCPEPNTIYKECTFYQACEDRGRDLGPATWCQEGCECLPGMYRNLRSQCVPENECECPVNEFLEKCEAPRPPESCRDLYKPYDARIPSACKPKCICRDGLSRDFEGKCIPVEQCPNYNCTSSEEYVSCVEDFDFCEQCGDDRCRNGEPIFLPHSQCTPKCMCKLGQNCRNSSGVCIKNEGPESCPKQNTQYSTCAKPPSAQSCDVRGVSQSPTTDCVKGCECMPGYYRNSILACVAPENCECLPTESYKCVNSCLPKTCADLARNNVLDCLGKLFPVRPGPNTPTCNNTCVCQTNHYRNRNGTCILYSGCPCPDPNAEMVECPYKCGGRTCADPVIRDVCPGIDCSIFSKFGCQCKAGYVRRSFINPTCVPLSQCPTAT